MYLNIFTLLLVSKLEKRELYLVKKNVRLLKNLFWRRLSEEVRNTLNLIIFSYTYLKYKLGNHLQFI